MDKRVALLVIVGALFSTPLSAEDITLMGVGTTSCGEFGKSYKQNPKLAEVVYLEWSRGFMSALNMSAGMEQKPMRNMGVIKPGQQAFYLRELCDERPLAAFMEIVFKYYLTLPEYPKH